MRNIFFTVLVLLLAVSCGRSGKGPVDASKELTMPEGHVTAAISDKAEVNIEAAEGGITLAVLFAEPQKYSGKTVKIKGKVVKVNTAILGKNWVHIQDGTEFNGEYDLTITTDSNPEIGSVLTFEGTITLDKDFGYGYSYKILMEEGRIAE